jgi:tetratricopeptide (TPR) repeat protein
MKRPLPVLISISILFFAATLACSFEAGPAPASTDLPRPTGTLPPTATATSTPTPLPTATPLPRTRITEAAQALHDGDYATALADYQAVLAGSTEADLIEQARLGLATIALQAGDNSGAIDQLQQFVQAYPASPQLADAWFGLGEANYAQANWQAAIDAYQEYLNLRGDLISAYVNERIGDAYSQMNDLENAASAYQTALAQATSNTNNANLREKLALTYRLLKRYNDALTQYDAILSFAQQSGYRAQVLYRAGQTLLDAGDTAGGYQRFVELVDNYPDRSDAYQALVAVVNAGVEVDEFQRGLVDYYATQYDAAVGQQEQSRRLLLSGYDLSRSGQHPGRDQIIQHRNHQLSRVGALGRCLDRQSGGAGEQRRSQQCVEHFEDVRDAACGLGAGARCIVARGWSIGSSW